MSADNFQNIPLKSETAKIIMKFVDEKRLDFKYDSEAIAYFVGRKMQEAGLPDKKEIEKICEQIDGANSILEIDEPAATFENEIGKNGVLEKYKEEIEKIFSNFAEQREASEGKNRK